MYSPLVGKKLRLFEPEDAKRREQLEDEVIRLFQEKGFNRIYTPFICKQELLDKLGTNQTVESPAFPKFVVQKPPLPEGVKEYRPEDLARYEECRQYAYLMPKHSSHILVCQSNLLSYRDLPRRVFELSDIYLLEDDDVINKAGFYLTSLVQEEQIAEEIENMGEYYHSHYQVESGYVGKDNKELFPSAICGYGFLDV